MDSSGFKQDRLIIYTIIYHHGMRFPFPLPESITIDPALALCDILIAPKTKEEEAIVTRSAV